MVKKNKKLVVTASALLLLSFGYLSEIFHYALVPHTRCELHGEWMHDDESHAHKSQSVSEALPGVETDKIHAEHTHCGVYVATRKQPLARPVLSLDLEPYFTSPLSFPTFTFHFSDYGKDWLFAPKNSPPNSPVRA